MKTFIDKIVDNIIYCEKHFGRAPKTLYIDYKKIQNLSKKNRKGYDEHLLIFDNINGTKYYIYNVEIIFR